MAKQSVSEQIISIRVAAGGDADRCSTCCRPAISPYRRTDARGNITEGCIDAAHEPHMIPSRNGQASIDWHFRKAAVAHRKAELSHLRSL